MDLISGSSLCRILALSLAHDRSPSLFLALTSCYHCSALSLSQECHSSLSLVRVCADAFYVLFQSNLDLGVSLCALVSLCDCGVCVAICVRSSPVDTAEVVHSREKSAKPQGEGMGRGNCFYPSGSHRLRGI